MPLGRLERPATTVADGLREFEVEAAEHVDVGAGQR
jgi:hypothetical protein